MRYLALASDYDNTLATEGAVPEAVVAGLRRLRASGRTLILVTGRELPDLLNVFPHVELFERVVAENGALLYRPHDRSQKLLAEPFPPKFLDALRALGVPVSVGQSILATVQPYETIVLECIRQFGLELHVIFNREAVMILPSGVNKASGLKVALSELQLSPHNLVAIGDGENDHAFIDVCECAVAVANAVPSLCEHADFVTSAPTGMGVLEVIEAMLREDFATASAKLTRHHLELGRTKRGEAVLLPPHASALLIAGESGARKTMLVAGFLEQLAARGHQFCIVDPAGAYERLEDAVSIGSAKQAPDMDELARLLEDPSENVVVNLSGIALDDQPTYVRELFATVQALRARLGRPHWLLVDEAHQLLSHSVWDGASLHSIALITQYPDRLAPALLQEITAVVAVGDEALPMLEQYARAAGLAKPAARLDAQLGPEEAFAWLRDRNQLLVFAYRQPHASG